MKNSQAVLLSALLAITMLLLSCKEPAQPGQDVNLTLNQAAENYVKLGLELGQYDKDYVDAYLGPKEWADLAENKPRSIDQLATDISELLQKIQNIAPKDKTLAIRQKALFRNVRAMDVRIRMLNGETFSFAEEARLIYDATLPTYDFSQFDLALDEIDQLIPGEGELASRVDAFKETFEVPPENVNAVVDKAIGECRARSGQHISLPPSENFELEYVTGKNWSGYNWYQGNNKSLMQVNQDFPMKIDRAIGLGCHEGYPGHHVWNVLVENELLVKNGWVEFSLYPLFSPYGLIAEGSANFGVDLAFPDEDNINYTRNVLFPLAGLDPEKATSLDQLNKLTTKLSHASTATAQLYLDGKISREEALELIRKYSLVSPQRAEQSLRFTEQYRAYVLNYNLGKDIVANYVNKQGDDQDSRWQAFEGMLTNLSTASDMQD
jgi:hypothetical protein